MKVLYILNDSCFYRRLCYISISTLRHYNREIPIEILYLCDDGRDSRDIANYNNLDLSVPWFNRQQFFDVCEALNVNLHIVTDFDLREESGYISAQRQEFVRIQGDEILLLDCDTFIFDDVAPLFDGLRHHDLIADKTGWGYLGGKMPIGKRKVTPLNSGVILFGKGLLQRYGRDLYDINIDIKHDRHYICAWLSAMEDHEPYERKKAGREEIAFTCWLVENNINFRYFDSSEVQTVFLRSRTRIYHSMTQNYLGAFMKYYRGGVFRPPIKIKPKFFINKA